MADAARRRFFAARASIAKREGAAQAGFRIVPPPGRFSLRIVDDAGVSLTEDLSGRLTIGNARLFHGDAEIDGATVTVDASISTNVRRQLQETGADVEGEAVLGDDGYVLVSHVDPEMRLAA